MYVRKVTVIGLVAILVFNGFAFSTGSEDNSEEWNFDLYEFPSGNGTADDPYMIHDIHDLQAISSHDHSAHYALANDIDASETIEWNNGTGFEPIRRYEFPFFGSFDGNGHAIRDLHINRPNENFTGLFGYVGVGAEIKNIGLVGGNISGFFMVGGLIGRNYGTMVNTYTMVYMRGAHSVGGLVGDNYGVITTSYSTSKVSAELGSFLGSGGGLVGNNHGTISDSYATGSVSGYLAGGLVGDNSGILSNTYALGTMRGFLSGSLVAYGDGTVSNSFWEIRPTRGQSMIGTGKPTEELMDITTFADAGWDIVAVDSLDDPNTDFKWNIVNHETYPFLSQGDIEPSEDGLPTRLFILVGAIITVIVLVLFVYRKKKRIKYREKQVNIFDSTIHNNQIGILSEGTHFAIKDTYVFDNDVSVELDGNGDRTLMVPVTGAYDRRPDKLEFVNFRSDLYSSKDGDSWSWIEELWRYGTDPYLTNDQTVETDGDGLSNVEEADEHGTDPLSPDTDGDGVPDGIDLHPFYDALLKLHIRESEERTLLSSTEPLIWSVEEDKWYSGLPQRYTPDPTFAEIGVTLPRNIPDYRATIHSHLEVSVWDYVYGGLSISYDLQYDVETGHITYLDKSEFGMWEPKDDGYVVLYRCDQREVELEMKMFVAPEINPGRQRTLAERHAPILRFHLLETFFPTHIENFLEQSSLYDGDGMLIKDEVTPQDLADNPDSENYLALDDAVEPHDYNVYARVATARNDWIIIQYWFFYMYDDKPVVGKHEGDWEMIQIELTPHGDPLFVGYSQHYGGEWAYWWDIEHVVWKYWWETEPLRDSPVVYVETGSHASKYEGGIWYIKGMWLHPADHDYGFTLLSNQSWLKFEGTWGDDSYSVQGPVFRYSKSHDILHSGPLAYMWIEPIRWRDVSLESW